MPNLSISTLSASVAEKNILTSLSLVIPEGESHAIMGPNGSGKSTLAHILAGHPDYMVTSGSITWGTQNLGSLTPEERAASGIFLAYQRPPSLPGVTVAQFLRLCQTSIAKRNHQPVPEYAAFISQLKSALRNVQLPWSTAERSVHDGLSGGEQKRLEIAMALVLRPKLLILDEIDSGLDVDALRIIGDVVTNYKLRQTDCTVLVITHYDRLLTHLPVDRVSILSEGTIIQTGDATLATHIQAVGYTHEQAR